MPLRNQPPTHIHFSSYNQTQVLTPEAINYRVAHDEVFYISKEWLELLIHTNRELENCVKKMILTVWNNDSENIKLDPLTLTRWVCRAGFDVEYSHR